MTFLMRSVSFRGFGNLTLDGLIRVMVLTWRIIPVSKWLISMVSLSPLSRVGSLPNGLFMAYKWGLLTTYDTWDDPPSSDEQFFAADTSGFSHQRDSGLALMLGVV